VQEQNVRLFSYARLIKLVSEPLHRLRQHGKRFGIRYIECVHCDEPRVAHAEPVVRLLRHLSEEVRRTLLMHVMIAYDGAPGCVQPIKRLACHSVGGTAAIFGNVPRQVYEANRICKCGVDLVNHGLQVSIILFVASRHVEIADMNSGNHASGIAVSGCKGLCCPRCSDAKIPPATPGEQVASRGVVVFVSGRAKSSSTKANAAMPHRPRKETR
jgi:hypothetical protein